MKNPGMNGALALVGIDLITFGLGTCVKAPQAYAAPVMGHSSLPKMTEISLDHGRESGRWNRALLVSNSLNTTATMSQGDDESSRREAEACTTGEQESYHPGFKHSPSSVRIKGSRHVKFYFRDHGWSDHSADGGLCANHLHHH